VTTNKAFRDYATRVSFNMTLSRNQIYALRSVMLDIELQDRSWDERTKATTELRRRVTGHETGNEFYHDNYVSGVRKLLAMGLFENDPRWTADQKQCDEARALGHNGYKKYWGPSYQITEAGHAVIALLRIAGLIEPAAANINKPKRRTARGRHAH